MSRRICFAIVVLIGYVAAASAQSPEPSASPAAGDPGGSEASAEAHYYLSIYLAERERLESGVFQLTGQKSDGIEGSERFPRYEGPITASCAFDRTRGLFRFVRTEPNLLEEATDMPIKRVTLDTAYLQTPDQSVLGVNGWHRDIGARDEFTIGPAATVPSEYCRATDYGSVGIGLWTDVFARRFAADILSDWSNRQTLEVVQESDDLTRLRQSVSFGDENGMLFTYWFSKKSGELPIRSQTEFSGPIAGDVPGPIEETSVSWKQLSGVWVPEWISMIQRAPVAADRRISSDDVSLTWESINEELPPEMFTWESLQPTAGSKIFDARLGQKVLVSVVEEPRVTELPARARQNENASKPVVGRFWILAINALVVCAIVGWLVWRRRVSRS